MQTGGQPVTSRGQSWQQLLPHGPQKATPRDQDPLIPAPPGLPASGHTDGQTGCRSGLWCRLDGFQGLETALGQGSGPGRGL